MAQFEYVWVVRITTDRELSEDAMNVIDDLKEEFVDAINNVLDIDDEFEQEANELAQVEEAREPGDESENEFDGDVYPFSK